jgi:hypothetical protein
MLVVEAMTLLDAQQYDEAKERRRLIVIVGLVVLVVLLVAFLWMNRYWPEKHAADKFFGALQRQDFETAYGIYFADSNWKQHPQKHAQYPYNEFWQDWGPGGQWGLIKNYEIYGESPCPGGSSGVVVDVVVNRRAEHAQIWVEKSDKTISTPPCDLQFR